MSVFDRLKAGLSRTARQIAEQFDALVRGSEGRPADEASLGTETLEGLEDLLLMADVGVAASRDIVAAVGARARGTASLRALVREELLRVLAAADRPHVEPASGPRVVLVVGVNGTGKTTTVGKLANQWKQAGRTPLICAADTFRAAAVDQLQVWADRAGVDLVRAREGADPAAVVFDAVTAAKARGRDLVLVDTAGRLHTRANLMQELEKIRRVIAREVPGAPHETLLVLDATVGQNALTQAREFMAVAGVTGIVLTKLDGTARGGIVVAIAHELNLPIRFVGVGEGIDDLLPFDPARYVDALFREQW
jgi:fused signal recognition particle receptor